MASLTKKAATLAVFLFTWYFGLKSTICTFCFTGLVIYVVRAYGKIQKTAKSDGVLHEIPTENDDQPNNQLNDVPNIRPSTVENPPAHQDTELVEALQIITMNDNHTITLNKTALQNLFKREDVGDKDIAIVSVAGAFRKGKSFLLNFMLRYLGAYNKLSQAEIDEGRWLGEVSEALKGFNWRAGSERHTTGIWFWKEPFFQKTETGQQIAIFVMDTQGTFDSHSTVKDNATIFALSVLISSIQIFNISCNIQENDLQHLQLFTNFGRIAENISATGQPSRIFQKLLILVRDWYYIKDHEYGLNGGENLREKRMGELGNKHYELKSLREDLKSSFDLVQCFLMPHPGKDVAANPEFNGCLELIDKDFKQQMVSLMTSLLSPTKIVHKKFNGERVTASHLLVSIESYVEALQGEKMPEMETLLTTNAKMHNLSAMDSARKHYAKQMENVCKGKYFLNQLMTEHKSILSSCVKMFRQYPKMGSEEFSKSYLTELEIELENTFNSYERQNSIKPKNPYFFKALGSCAVTVSTAAGAAATALAAGEAAVALGATALALEGVAGVAGVAAAIPLALAAAPVAVLAVASLTCVAAGAIGVSLIMKL